MQQGALSFEEILDLAVEAFSAREPSGIEILDELPVPIYTTDCEGRVSYFNKACVAFAGRTPVPGQDLWCVTWKLFTGEGAALPHDQCPMAVAIAERRPVRGVEAIAERPDGTRVRFRPYPTPLFDADGAVIGAVNLVMDVTDRKQVAHLRSQAERCRRLARSIEDASTRKTLSTMAEDYEERARSLVRLN